MAKSIISNEKECFRCKTTINLHKHHIFSGPFRNKSEKYGCWCYLCMTHHTGSQGVHTHNGTEYWKQLKQLCQRKFEEQYSHELFMKEFKRNNL